MKSIANYLIDKIVSGSSPEQVLAEALTGYTKSSVNNVSTVWSKSKSKILSSKVKDKTKLTKTVNDLDKLITKLSSIGSSTNATKVLGDIMNLLSAGVSNFGDDYEDTPTAYNDVIDAAGTAEDAALNADD